MRRVFEDDRRPPTRRPPRFSERRRHVFRRPNWVHPSGAVPAVRESGRVRFSARKTSAFIECAIGSRNHSKPFCQRKKFLKSAWNVILKAPERPRPSTFFGFWVLLGRYFRLRKYPAGGRPRPPLPFSTPEIYQNFPLFGLSEGDDPLNWNSRKPTTLHAQDPASAEDDKTRQCARLPWSKALEKTPVFTSQTMTNGPCRAYSKAPARGAFRKCAQPTSMRGWMPRDCASSPNGAARPRTRLAPRPSDHVSSSPSLPRWALNTRIFRGSRKKLPIAVEKGRVHLRELGFHRSEPRCLGGP